MKIPTPVLFVLLGMEFILGCMSFGFIMDKTNHWPAWSAMGILGMWGVLCCGTFGSTIKPLIDRS